MKTELYGAPRELTGELVPGLVVRQFFKPVGVRLWSVDVALATYRRVLTQGLLWMSVIHDGKIKTKRMVSASKVKDNEFCTFHLDVEVDPHCMYELRLEAQGSFRGMACSAKYGPSQHRKGRFFLGPRWLKGKELNCRLDYRQPEANSVPVDLSKGVDGSMAAVGQVSVVVPYYNTADLIEGCLRSVGRQSYRFLEVIVVDDSSAQPLPGADRMRKWLPEGMKLKVFAHKANRGAAATRNTGARKAVGEYLYFLDSDTTLMPNALERYLAAVIDGGADFAYSNFRWGNQEIKGQPWNLDALRRRNYISTMSLVRRAVFPGFDESLRRHQDWDLWLSVGEKGNKGTWVDDILFSSPRRQGGISTGGSIGLKESEAIIRRKHGM